MMFQFYFKKMASSETLKDLSKRKLSDLVERFVGTNGLVRITFQSEKKAQRVLCLLQGHNGKSYRASASSDNMYANLDAVAHKLETQLLRVKTRNNSNCQSQKHKSRFAETRLRLIYEGEYPSENLDFWGDEYDSSLRYFH
ncbi:MAG: ribosome-associated translation inhibitor RaiA [Oligoflexus sp.]|nr:ribosome-associated translation inhibitor RaiA [Oligoflexus sp.]